MAFANEYEGLRIAGTDFHYLNRGDYGVVFVDKNIGRIRKVYCARYDADKAHCSEVFSAEIDAYTVATNQPELLALIPGNFSVCEPQAIFDGANNDVTKEFYNDLTFEADYIPCDFVKIRQARVLRTEYDRVISLFWRHGIAHICDASVCASEGTIIKIIDFAMRDVELWHKPL